MKEEVRNKMALADELRFNADYSNCGEKYFKVKEFYKSLKSEMWNASVKGLRNIELGCEEDFQLEVEYNILSHFVTADGLKLKWMNRKLYIVW